jgi:hypothetical protein
MTQIPREFLELLKLLNQHGVKYLVIGGYAVVLHGHNRMTGDLDLFIELSAENAEAFCAAYNEFGLGRGEVTAADFLEEGKMIRAGFEPMRLEFPESRSRSVIRIEWKSKSKVSQFNLSVATN